MDNSSSDISLISLKLSKLPPTLLNDPITNLYAQNGLWLDSNYKILGPSDFWEAQNHLHKLVFRRAVDTAQLDNIGILRIMWFW